MATTPGRQIPYAASTDAPDVPYWSQRQAERLEVLLDAVDGKFNVDTWTLCTIPNGHTPLDGNKLSTRFGLDGKSVEFSGGISIAAANTAGTIATIAKVSNRPAQPRNFIVATSKGAQPIQVQPGGAIVTGAVTYAIGDWIDLASMRFATDPQR